MHLTKEQFLATNPNVIRNVEKINESVNKRFVAALGKKRFS
jgi:hypothetical protein